MRQSETRFRQVTHVLACLSIGALLTFVVAWTAVAVRQPRWVSTWSKYELKLAREGRAAPFDELWPPGCDGELSIYRQLRHCQTFGLSMIEILEYCRLPAHVKPVAQSTRRAELWRAGWPCRAVWGICDLDTGASRGAVTIEGHASTKGPIGLNLPTGTATYPPRLLPYRVRPIGFAINTLIYAILFASLRAFAVRLRRSARRRRGLCESCSYSLAGIGEMVPCPECGQARPGFS